MTWVMCGWCGSTDTYAETVDNGGGMQQVDAAQCNHCGATEMSPYHTVDDIDPEDAKRGWYAGPDTGEIISRDEAEIAGRVASKSMFASDYKNGERLLVEFQDTIHAGWKRLSFSSPVFQTICGRETTVGGKPAVEAITCFECIVKGRVF